MKRNGYRAQRFDWFAFNDACYEGIERSMEMMGSVQRVDPQSMIKAQNQAIRDCWLVTGDLIRQAMITVSESTGVYPEELKDDEVCRKMIKAKGVEL